MYFDGNNLLYDMLVTLSWPAPSIRLLVPLIKKWPPLVLLLSDPQPSALNGIRHIWCVSIAVSIFVVILVEFTSTNTNTVVQIQIQIQYLSNQPIQLKILRRQCCPCLYSQQNTNENTYLWSKLRKSKYIKLIRRQQTYLTKAYF